jgi:hypothetical protein
MSRENIVCILKVIAEYARPSVAYRDLHYPLFRESARTLPQMAAAVCYNLWKLRVRVKFEKI